MSKGLGTGMALMLTVLVVKATRSITSRHLQTSLGSVAHDRSPSLLEAAKLLIRVRM